MVGASLYVALNIIRLYTRCTKFVIREVTMNGWWAVGCVIVTMVALELLRFKILQGYWPWKR